jgi:hypothetical protein
MTLIPITYHALQTYSVADLIVYGNLAAVPGLTEAILRTLPSAVIAARFSLPTI